VCDGKTLVPRLRAVPAERSCGACGPGFTQAETDAGERPGLTSDERAEPARLRRENRPVRQDVGGRLDLDDLDHRARPAHHDSAEPSADTVSTLFATMVPSRIRIGSSETLMPVLRPTAWTGLPRSRAPGGVASSAAH
jgi:hypothetical protein